MKKLLLLFITLIFSISLYAQTVESYLKSAIDKQNAGDNDGAITDCNKALALDAGNATVFNVRGLSKYNQGLYADAIDDYTRTIRTIPTAAAFNYRGSAKYYLGQYKEAIKDFNEAIHLYSKYVSAYNNRGNAKIMLEFYSEALADFNESVNINPENAGAYNNRAFVKNKLHKYNEAIADANKAISLDPKYDAGGYRNRGNAKIGLGMYEEGIADCNKAIALDPQNAKAYNYRGYAYFKMGKYNLAIKDDDSATDFQKDHDLAPFWGYRDALEDKLKSQGINPQVFATTTPSNNTSPIVATNPKPTARPETAKAIPPIETTNAITSVPTSKVTIPSEGQKAVVAPETTAANAIVNLDWSKPVDDISSLPNGVLRLVENNEVNIKIKASSYAPLEKDKFHLFVNGEDISNGNKMTTADVEELKHKGNGVYRYNYVTTIKVGMNKSVIKLVYGNYTSDELIVTYTPTDINLHVLAIGTHSPNLKYPEKDARDFAALFASQKGEKRLFHEVSTELLLGDTASAAAMGDKIAEWGNKQYNERDVLMLFISSHGFMNDGRLWITGSNYKSTNKRATTIDFKDQVLEPLESINCKKIIFIDACQSGGGVSIGGKATEADIANEISKMASSGNGITIISSSSSTELSWEDDSWGNGAFTKAIKEALHDMKADKDENGLISMNELYDYIKLRVAELVRLAGKKDSNGNFVSQTPKMYNPRGNVSIYLK